MVLHYVGIFFTFMKKGSHDGNKGPSGLEGPSLLNFAQKGYQCEGPLSFASNGCCLGMM